MNSHLNGRTVLVTGAGNGFGRLICELSAARGANVVGADINADGLAETATTIEKDGGTFAHQVTDVTDKAQTDAVARLAVERFGSIDVLVNCAGIMPLAFFADHERAWRAWDTCIDINFKGVVHGIASVHDQMTRQGRGHIVNVSSIYGNAGAAGSGVYSATKAAVNVLSESLRVESQGKIKVTVVRPTGIPGTGLMNSIINPEAVLGIIGHNMKRFQARTAQATDGTLPPEYADSDDPRYWVPTPKELAENVLYTIDQPWGVSISDITVRATGEDMVL
ncbi:SDR family oxidoreductase [Streptomyces bobili]|uniref:SDR family oxidoreductase n=1 Tax=Streptomyces bobili TaxID=67280 RepID=UPI0036FAD37A